MTPWYAIHTLAQKEALAAWTLQSLGYEVLFLHIFARVKHARKTRCVMRPLFPRYIFCGVPNAHSTAGINRAFGVSTVVFLGDKPLPVPPEVIEELRSRGNASGLVKLAPEQMAGYRKRFRQGDHVRVTEGPLAGLLAVVELDKGDAVRLWLEMFGGKVEAQMDPKGLEHASPDRGTMRKNPRR